MRRELQMRLTNSFINYVILMVMELLEGTERYQI